jgi:hypothetical protein
MLFPIKHENMKARRWPLVTIGLILVNTLVFLCTHQAMEDQKDPLLSVKAQVLVLAAQHPELTVPPKAQQLVTDFQRYYPANWAEMQNLSAAGCDWAIVSDQLRLDRQSSAAAMEGEDSKPAR